MKLFKSPLRRTGAVVAGSVIGLASVAFFAGPASAHHSEVTGFGKCNETTGNWDIAWEVKAIGQGPWALTKVESNQPGSPVEGIVANKEYTGKQVTGTQSVPGTATDITLTVFTQWTNGHKDDGDKTGKAVLEEGGCKKDEPSTPPTTESPSPSPSPSTPAIPELPGEPEPVLDITCDTITLGIDNPADGTEIDMKFETSKGEVRETTVAPGEKKSETFSATEGFTVDWTLSAEIDGKTESFTETVNYTQPDDCENGGGGGLPVTGAAAGGIAGGAGALLVVGAGLFMMARRRKVKFTA